MATFNLRIDEDLKNKAYKAFDGMGLKPTEAVRLLFQYVAENNKFPIQTVVLSDEDVNLLNDARDRLLNPAERIKVSLDDL